MWKIALSPFRKRGRRHIPALHSSPAQPDAQLDIITSYWSGSPSAFVALRSSACRVQELGRLVEVATPTIDAVLALVQERGRQAGLYGNDAKR